jgi:hypothetical protein
MPTLDWAEYAGHISVSLFAPLATWVAIWLVRRHRDRKAKEASL